MTLEQAMAKIEQLQIENKKLSQRNQMLEKLMLEDTMDDYEDPFPEDDFHFEVDE